jgi:hypothetical protein
MDDEEELRREVGREAAEAAMRAGYVTKATSSPPLEPVPRRPDLITISYEDVADVVCEAIHWRAEPLERRMKELEERMKAVEAELAKFTKPRAVIG